MKKIHGNIASFMGSKSQTQLEREASIAIMTTIVVVVFVVCNSFESLLFILHSQELLTGNHRDRITEAKVSSYSKDRNFTFHGEQAWHPLDNATPSNFLFPKSLDQELSADVSFVSVLAMVLSEYWKRLEKIYFYNFRHFEKLRK